MSNQCPDPAVGQVWIWHDDWNVRLPMKSDDRGGVGVVLHRVVREQRLVSKGTQAMITHISASVEHPPKPRVMLGADDIGKYWPPQGAKLIAGPGAPWFPDSGGPGQWGGVPPPAPLHRPVADLVADLQSRIDNNDTRIAPGKVLRLFDEAITAIKATHMAALLTPIRSEDARVEDALDLSVALGQHILDLTRRLVDSAYVGPKSDRSFVQVDPETFRELQAALAAWEKK